MKNLIMIFAMGCVPMVFCSCANKENPKIQESVQGEETRAQLLYKISILETRVRDLESQVSALNGTDGEQYISNQQMSNCLADVIDNWSDTCGEAIPDKDDAYFSGGDCAIDVAQYCLEEFSFPIASSK